MDLLVDDVRSFHVDITARTYEAGLVVLQTQTITHLWLDYDLGYGKSGLDLLEKVFGLEIFPEKVTLVSQSPPGLKSPRELLNRCGKYKQSNPTTYILNQPQSNKQEG